VPKVHWATFCALDFHRENCRVYQLRRRVAKGQYFEGVWSLEGDPSAPIKHSTTATAAQVVSQLSLDRAPKEEFKR